MHYWRGESKGLALGVTLKFLVQGVARVQAGRIGWSNSLWGPECHAKDFGIYLYACGCTGGFYTFSFSKNYYVEII